MTSLLRLLTLAVLAMAVLLGTCSAQAHKSRTSSGSTAGDGEHTSLRDQVTRMEQQLANADKTKDKGFFEKTLTPDFLYVAYNGLVFTKRELLSKMVYIDVKQYAMKNFKVRPIGRAGALLTYDLDIQASAAGRHAPAKQYASSVWVNERGSWKLLFHQATPAEH